MGGTTRRRGPAGPRALGLGNLQGSILGVLCSREGADGEGGVCTGGMQGASAGEIQVPRVPAGMLRGAKRGGGVYAKRCMCRRPSNQVLPINRGEGFCRKAVASVSMGVERGFCSATGATGGDGAAAGAKQCTVAKTHRAGLMYSSGAARGAVAGQRVSGSGVRCSWLGGSLPHRTAGGGRRGRQHAGRPQPRYPTRGGARRMAEASSGTGWASTFFCSSCSAVSTHSARGGGAGQPWGAREGPSSGGGGGGGWRPPPALRVKPRTG